MVFDDVPGSIKHLSIVFALCYFGSSVIWMFLPVFFEQVVDNVFLVGVLTSIPAFTTLFMDMPIANMIQRMDAKFLAFTGVLMFSLPGLIYFTAFVPLLFLGKVVEGVSKTLRWESGWFLAMTESNSQNESESIAVFGLGKSVAEIFGPVIGGLVIFYFGFRHGLILWSLLGFSAAVFFYKYLGFSVDRLSDAFSSVFKKKTYSDDWKHLKENWESMRWAVMLILLQSFLFSFFWVAVPLMMEEIGANYIEMGVLFGLISIPSTLQVYVGRWADKVGWLNAVKVLSLILVPVLAITAFMESIVTAGLLILFSMALTISMGPVLHSFFDKSVDDSVEGEMVGVLELFKHSGQFLGPFMAGSVASAFGISNSFIFAAFLSLLLFSGVSFVSFFVE